MGQLLTPLHQKVLVWQNLCSHQSLQHFTPSLARDRRVDEVGATLPPCYDPFPKESHLIGRTCKSSTGRVCLEEERLVVFSLTGKPQVDYYRTQCQIIHLPSLTPSLVRAHARNPKQKLNNWQHNPAACHTLAHCQAPVTVSVANNSLGLQLLTITDLARAYGPDSIYSSCFLKVQDEKCRWCLSRVKTRRSYHTAAHKAIHNSLNIANIPPV